MARLLRGLGHWHREKSSSVPFFIGETKVFSNYGQYIAKAASKSYYSQSKDKLILDSIKSQSLSIAFTVESNIQMKTKYL